MKHYGYSKHKDGYVHPVQPEKNYDLSCHNMTELILPKAPVSELVDCSNNDLKELYIPDGIKYIFCWNNPNLETVRIPDSLKLLCCDLGLIEKNYMEWIDKTFHVTNGTDGTAFQDILNFESSRILANKIFFREGYDMRL